MLSIGISISKKTKYISYAQTITFVTNIALNFLLIPKYSAWGAAMAFLGGTVVQSLSYHWFNQKVYPIPYDFWRMQFFSFGLFLVVLVNTILVRGLAFGPTMLLAVLFGIGLVLLAWHVGLNKEERYKILLHLPLLTGYLRSR